VGKGRRVRAGRVAAESSAAVGSLWVSPPTAVEQAPSTDWSGSPRVASTGGSPTSLWRRSHCDRLRAIADERAGVRRRLDELDAAVVEQVRRERSAGASWADVGRALGVSRQAARQRFATGQPATDGPGHG